MQAHLQRYQFIAENTLDLVCETTLDGFYTYLSPSYHDVLGYDPEDLIGRHFAELLHPDERQAVLAEFARRTEALSPGSATFRYRCKDGAWRWLETLGKPCPSPDNAIRAVFVSRDITDRKEAELSLRRMEDRLLLVVNHTPVILCATDAAGVITLFEGHGLESMGFGAAPAIGRPFSEVFSNQPEMLASFRRALAGETLVATVEANGRSLETYLTPALDDTNAVTGMSSVSLDVTESRAIRRALEEEQLKRAKLESLAVLAGGIAHNFNNLLTAILGNLSLAQMDAHPDSLIAEALGEAEAACLKTRDMVAELGTFARGGGPIKKLVRLQPCIRRAVLSATRGGRVQCDIRIDPALSHAEVDELQIAQVLQNLLRNACEATPENGTIGIDAHNAAPPDSLPPGSYVAIRVTDHGPGIAEANLQRIFDPYFTTKKGRLGLGLATAHSIIANHGGVLVAQSPAGDPAPSSPSISRPATGRRRPLLQAAFEAMMPAASWSWMMRKPSAHSSTRVSLPPAFKSRPSPAEKMLSGSTALRSIPATPSMPLSWTLPSLRG